jgi:hypothetical protein
MNFIIEGNLNFYDELYKSLDSDSEDNSNNVCLITGTALIDKFVVLECNHSFNYAALYTEICKQKFEFQTYSTDSLSKNDLHFIKNNNIHYYIKCPYCRHVQYTLLPYYPDLPFIKKYGVNTDDIDFKVVKVFIPPSLYNPITSSYKIYGYTFKKGTCCHLTNFNNKNIPCYNTISTEIFAPDGTIKTFCSIHVKENVKKFHLEIQETKKINKATKLFEKELMKKDKQTKLLEKKIKKKDTTNAVISSVCDISVFQTDLNTTSSSNKCCAILKTGSKKGLQCGNTSFQNNVCKRHQCPIVKTIE